jgi:hypothetical protein
MKKNAVTVSIGFIVVTMLLVLSALLLLFFLQTVFQKTGAELVPEERCRVSVEREARLHAIAKQPGGGYTADDFASNIECRRIPIELHGNDAESLAGKTAALMNKCWSIFGQGKELFSEGKSDFCHQCFIITYDAGTSFAFAGTAARLSAASLKGRHDVPETIVGGVYGIIFKASPSGVAQLLVRPLTPEGLKPCENAAFVRERA